MPSFLERIKARKFASAASTAVDIGVDGDTQSRLAVDAGGKLTWGDGGTTGDTNLYRDAANVLKTDDTLKVPTLFVDGIEIDTTGAVSQDILIFNGTKFTAASASFEGGGGASLTVSDTPPANPGEGDLWFESDTAKTYVYYDSTWVEVGASGGVATLNDIGDVDATSPNVGDSLQWDGSVWTSASVAATVISSLDDIDDVEIDTPLTYQGLMYDGSTWVNSSIPNVFLVRNDSGSTILKGTLVAANGAEGSGRINIVPYETTGLQNSELRAMGILAQTLTDGQSGEVMSFGTLKSLDTRGTVASGLAVGDETWAAGDILYAHPTVAGKLTKVQPQHDFPVAFITVLGNGNGQIAIRVIPGNNHLEWMHDVSLTSASAGDFLKYNGSLWVNDEINLGTDTVGNYLSSITAGTGISVNFTPSEGAGASVSLNATLNDLTDVSTAGAVTGDVIKFNGSSWTAASAAAGGSSVTVSSTAPVSPSAGDLWFDSDTAQTYVYYDSAWVEIGSSSPARLTISSSPPANPIQGSMWFDSDDGATYTYYGSTWVEVGASSVESLLSTIDAKGDLLVGTADNTVDNLPVGTNGQILVANSATATGLQWQTPTYASTGKAIAMSIVFGG